MSFGLLDLDVFMLAGIFLLDVIAYTFANRNRARHWGYALPLGGFAALMRYGR